MPEWFRDVSLVVAMLSVAGTLWKVSATWTRMSVALKTVEEHLTRLDVAVADSQARREKLEQQIQDIRLACASRGGC